MVSQIIKLSAIFSLLLLFFNHSYLTNLGVKKLIGGDKSKGTWACKWVCEACTVEFQQKGSEFSPN